MTLTSRELIRRELLTYLVEADFVGSTDDGLAVHHAQQGLLYAQLGGDALQGIFSRILRPTSAAR